jgi:hypothetical protein
VPFRIKERLFCVLLLTFVAIVTFVSVLFLWLGHPPKETKLIEGFYKHKPRYEQLRNMLQTDTKVSRVAPWGIETTDSVGVSTPPQGGMSLNRYSEYLALFKEIGAIGASRSPGESTGNVAIRLWASGFAGNTKHIDICWLEKEPTDQVGSLDQYRRASKSRHPVFRRIEGNWYLWAD